MKTEPMTSTEQKRFSIHTFTQKLGPFLGLLILVLIVSVLNPSFLEPLNILNLLRQVAINALIAFGMTFVILTGGIDLCRSHPRLIERIGRRYDGLRHRSDLSRHHRLRDRRRTRHDKRIINHKGKMAPFIATLATMTVFRGLTLVYTDGNPITGLGSNYAFQLFGRGYFLGIPVPAITMLIAFAVPVGSSAQNTVLPDIRHRRQ